jgi:hypothetical protein
MPRSPMSVCVTVATRWPKAPPPGCAGRPAAAVALLLSDVIVAPMETDFRRELRPARVTAPDYFTGAEKAQIRCS